MPLKLYVFHFSRTVSVPMMFCCKVGLIVADGLSEPLLMLLLWGEVKGSTVVGEPVEFPQGHTSCLFLRSYERLAWTLS